jgi:hypothetical protein
MTDFDEIDDVTSRPFISIYGGAGVGKTSLLVTLQGEIRIADAEDGLISLGKYFKQFPEEKKRIKRKAIESLDDMREFYQSCVKAKPDWLILDSGSRLAELITINYDKTLTDKQKAFGAMYRLVENDVSALLWGLKKLSAMGIGVVVIFKEEIKKIQISEDTSIDKFSLWMPREKMILDASHIFDETYRMIVVQEKQADGIYASRRKLITNNDGRSQAKSRLGFDALVDVTDGGFADLFKGQF